MKKLSLVQPDDWHLHLRDEEKLTSTVATSVRSFARAIIMPNLTSPITTIVMAEAYRQRILAAIPPGKAFQPLMTLYLTDHMTADIIKAAAEHEHIHAAKLYPAGATTNSQAGVQDLTGLYKIFAAMEKHGLPLLIHGEIADKNIDIFDREAQFIEQQLLPITQAFPQLKIVLEHITTKEAVDFILASSAQVAATITVHHLLFNRNDLLAGGIKPHYYCLPILKRQIHQQALITAATSGNPKFFLGTDSAPHAVNAKESACGCAGIYSAPAALELYAEVFENTQALDKLEGFASHFGADFYGLPRNTARITLTKQNWQMPQELPFGATVIKPIKAGETISWRLEEYHE